MGAAVLPKTIKTENRKQAASASTKALNIKNKTTTAAEAPKQQQQQLQQEL